jgi:hypothetical protein
MPRKSQYKKKSHHKRRKTYRKTYRKSGKNKTVTCRKTCNICNRKINKNMQMGGQKGGCGCSASLQGQSGGNSNLLTSQYNSPELASINSYPLNQYNNNNYLIGQSSRNLSNGVFNGGRRRGQTLKNKTMKGGGFFDSWIDPIIGNSTNPVLNANTLTGAIFAGNVIPGNNLPSTLGQLPIVQPAANLYNQYNKPLI